MLFAGNFAWKLCSVENSDEEMVISMKIYYSASGWKKGRGKYRNIY